MRSVSLATVAGALGASVGVAVAVATLAGLVCLAVAAWLVRRADGDRRAFAIVVTACVIGSSDRVAQLRGAPLRPDRDHVAATRARVVLRVRDLARRASPRSRPRKRCRGRPPGVTEQAWLSSHADPRALVSGGVDGDRRARCGGACDQESQRRRRSDDRDTSVSMSNRTRRPPCHALSQPLPTASDRLDSASVDRIRAPDRRVGRVVCDIRCRISLIGPTLPVPWVLPDELIYSEMAKSIAEGSLPAVRDEPTRAYGILYPLLVAPAWAALR